MRKVGGFQFLTEYEMRVLANQARRRGRRRQPLRRLGSFPDDDLLLRKPFASGGKTSRLDSGPVDQATVDFGQMTCPGASSPFRNWSRTSNGRPVFRLNSSNVSPSAPARDHQGDRSSIGNHVVDAMFKPSVEGAGRHGPDLSMTSGIASARILAARHDRQLFRSPLCQPP